MTTTKPQSLDSQLELAKWIAIITMVIDHAGFFFSDKVDYVLWRSIGRLCWPLIAWIVAMRLYTAPERTLGYLKRLLPWAIIAQFPYSFIFNAHHVSNGVLDPRPWYALLNIFVTIGLGCIVFMLVERWEKAGPARKVLLALGIIAAVAPGPVADYGPLAIVSIPVLVLLARQSLVQAAVACGVFGVVVNLLSLIHNNILDQYWGMALSALLASGIALFCLKTYLPLWRLPRWFFYAFYPLHLVLLVLLRTVVG